MFENGTSSQNETDYPKTDYPRQLLIHERTQPKDQVFDDIIAPTLYSIIGFVPLLYLLYISKWAENGMKAGQAISRSSDHQNQIKLEKGHFKTFFE